MTGGQRRATASAAERLWDELGQTMRQLRGLAGVSLREAEVVSGWRRGTLSQVENGKARPSRALVDWYEQRFDGDGLLVSLYGEARAGHGAPRDLPPPFPATGEPSADLAEVWLAEPALGLLVARGASLVAGWTVTNIGAQAWPVRTVRRVGAYAGPRLIASPPSVPLPALEPGQSVEVRVPVVAPAFAGTAVASWQVVDDGGRACLPDQSFSIALLVR